MVFFCVKWKSYVFQYAFILIWMNDFFHSFNVYMKNSIEYTIYNK